MSDFQLASILVDTESNIRDTDGLYDYQRAYATDQNGAELFWKDPDWLWVTHSQCVFRWSTDVTAPSDLLDNILKSYTLPKLGSMDSLRVSAFFSVTTDANSTISVKLGPVSPVTCFSLSMLNLGSSLNLVTEMRNRASASSQVWFSSDKRIFGNAPATAPVTTGKDTGTAGKVLTVNAQMSNTGHSVIMNWFEVSLCGGGIV